jgi:hypothetical protein
MIKQITNFLTEKRSYLKKGDEYLATKFGCSPRTINRIKRSLINVKRDYIASL